jgi:hypothetical protein
MKTSALVALVALAAVTAAPSPAGAETTKKGAGYEYWFQDDPLRASADGASGPMIVVVQGKRRDALMRPRVAFVTELLKSVEAL